MRRFFILSAALAGLLIPGSSEAGGLRVDPGSDALPLIRHVGVENSGIERDPLLRHVLEQFLGDARDDLLIPDGRTVETVLAALARPAPVPPQYLHLRSMMAFWGCSEPACRLKAAVVLSLRDNTACIFLHHTELEPENPAAYVASSENPATATFHAEILEGGAGDHRKSVGYECQRELINASQRARPQGYWLKRGTIVLRSGPSFKPGALPAETWEIWNGRDPNR